MVPHGRQPEQPKQLGSQELVWQRETWAVWGLDDPCLHHVLDQGDAWDGV